MTTAIISAASQARLDAHKRELAERARLWFDRALWWAGRDSDVAKSQADINLVYAAQNESASHAKTWDELAAALNIVV